MKWSGRVCGSGWWLRKIFVSSQTRTIRYRASDSRHAYYLRFSFHRSFRKSFQKLKRLVLWSEDKLVIVKDIFNQYRPHIEMSTAKGRAFAAAAGLISAPKMRYPHADTQTHTFSHTLLGAYKRSYTASTLHQPYLLNLRAYKTHGPRGFHTSGMWRKDHRCPYEILSLPTNASMTDVKKGENLEVQYVNYCANATCNAKCTCNVESVSFLLILPYELR